MPLSGTEPRSRAPRRGVVEGPYVGSAVQPPPLAVRVPRAATVTGGTRTLLPGRSERAEDVDHCDGAVPQLLVEPAYEGGSEQPQLGGPRGRSGAHHQLA